MYPDVSSFCSFHFVFLTLEYSWLTMLYYFQVYDKEAQPKIYMDLFFFQILFPVMLL